MSPKVDDFVGEPLTLLETISVFLCAAREFGGDCGHVCGSDVYDLFGRVGDGDVEKALFQIRGVNCQSIVEFWILAFNQI